jgi:poly(A) polymerase
LRFFRFSARFGHEPYDANGLAACQDFASHLPHLARERVTEEFLKILELPSPLYALEAMKDTGVLTYILYPGTWDDLKALVPLEKEVERTPSGLMRLAAFHPVLAEMKASLRLSKKQESTLSFLNKKHALVTEACFKHQAYLWSKEKTFDLALLQTARRIAASALPFDEGVAFFKCLCSQFEPWITPVFPVTGEDLLSRGVKQGKDLGVLLKAIETWWISQDFTPTRENCLAYLKTLVE